MRFVDVMYAFPDLLLIILLRAILGTHPPCAGEVHLDGQRIERPCRDVGIVYQDYSLYDFLTFAVMLAVFHAGEALFRTGWFVESLATQTLIIFVIRTADRPWASRPSPALVCGVGSCAAAGALLPYTPIAPWLGFAPLPPLFFGFLLFMIVSYLGLVEVVKRWFYRRYPA